MIKLKKAEGTLVNLRRRYKNAPPGFRNPVWAYVSFPYKNYWITSKNMINMRWNSKDGQPVTVWYTEGNPHTVFKHAWVARLSGGRLHF